MTMITEMVLLLAMLQVKHLVIDWCWQPEYEWKNKGTYGHPGGIRHAGKNAIGTAMCFMPFVGPIAVVMVLFVDFILHYHIDWAKMNINRVKGWGPTTHPQFWALTGADQFAHQLCYLLLVLSVYYGQ